MKKKKKKKEQVMEGTRSNNLDPATRPSTRNLKRFSSCGKTARQVPFLSFLLLFLPVPLLDHRKFDQCSN